MARLGLRLGIVGAIVLTMGGSLMVPGLAAGAAPKCNIAPNPAACRAAVAGARNFYFVHKAGVNLAAHDRITDGPPVHAVVLRKAAEARHHRWLARCATLSVARQSGCMARADKFFATRVATVTGDRHTRVGHLMGRRDHRVGHLIDKLLARLSKAGTL